MNEQLQNALATLLEKTTQGVEQGVMFLEAEIPDVLSQLLMWYGVKSGISTLAGVALLIFMLLYVEKKAYKMIKEWNEDDLGFLYFGVGSFLRLIIYPAPFMMMSLDWLQIWIAPKIWLIEYSAKFVQ